MHETIRNSALKLYAFLFRYPTNRHVDIIFEPGLEELLHFSFFKNSPEMKQFYAWRALFLNKTGELLETLQVEYTRLFINAYPSVLAPPYASFYKEHSLMGNVSVAIMDAYSQNGFVLNPEIHDMPDHISVLLEFLYRLLETESSKKKARQVFHQYLNWWLPEWIKQIEAHASEPFYPLVANAMYKFLKTEIS